MKKLSNTEAEWKKSVLKKKMRVVDLVKTKTRPWRHIYHDIGIPRPKNRDIEFQGLKYHGEKQRQLSHDIVIPRYFFRGQKATISRFQDSKTMTSRFQEQKATTSSFCGILTYTPPDMFLCYSEKACHDLS